MGAPKAPRIFQPNQKIRGNVDPLSVPIGFRAQKIGTEKEFFKSEHLGEGEFRNQVFTEKEFNERKAKEDIQRKNFRVAPEDEKFISQLEGFKTRNVDIFQIVPRNQQTTQQQPSKPKETEAQRLQRERKAKFAGLGGGNPTQIQSIRRVRASGRSALRTSSLSLGSGSGVAIKGYA
tara:strand:- start:132 stop:662 length:531 start_codon:yes stop_codon:yes gene_type:complete